MAAGVITLIVAGVAAMLGGMQNVPDGTTYQPILVYGVAPLIFRSKGLDYIESARNYLIIGAVALLPFGFFFLRFAFWMIGRALHS